MLRIGTSTAAAVGMAATVAMVVAGLAPFAWPWVSMLAAQAR